MMPATLANAPAQHVAQIAVQPGVEAQASHARLVLANALEREPERRSARGPSSAPRTPRRRAARRSRTEQGPTPAGRRASRGEECRRCHCRHRSPESSESSGPTAPSRGPCVIIRKYTSRTCDTMSPNSAARPVPTRKPPATDVQNAGLIRRREDADAVRGDAEEAGVTERGQAGVADEQVQAHRQDPENHDLREQSHPIRRHERRTRRAGRRGSTDRQAAASTRAVDSTLGHTTPLA